MGLLFSSKCDIVPDMHTIRRSLIDPDLFEVWLNDDLLEEISAPFTIRKFPSSFDSLEAVIRWLQDKEWKLARYWGYRWLSQKNHSTVQMRRKLEQKRFSVSVCDRLIEELKRNGYLQDDAVAESAIFREWKKGYGPRYIEMKLRSQGLNGEKVREFITDEMQKEQIGRLISKFSKFSARSEKQKSVRLLQRRGFDLHLIIEIFSYPS